MNESGDAKSSEAKSNTANNDIRAEPEMEAGNKPTRNRKSVSYWLLLLVKAFLIALVVVAIGTYIFFTPRLFGYTLGHIILMPYPPDESYDVKALRGIERQDVLFTTADGATLHGWFYRKPGSKYVTVVTHGNAGHIGGRLLLADALLESGVSVLLYDYRGYGDRPALGATALREPPRDLFERDGSELVELLFVEGLRQIYILDAKGLQALVQIFHFGKCAEGAGAGALRQQDDLHSVVCNWHQADCSAITVLRIHTSILEKQVLYTSLEQMETLHRRINVQRCAISKSFY
jgi:hypothetical protein